MTFGCSLPAQGPLATPENLRTIARHAEEAGLDSVWASDHVAMPAHIAPRYPYSATGEFTMGTTSPFIDPLIALSYVAGVTQRVRLGTHVLVVPYRNPVLVAKLVASLDYLSGGRVILGVGVGWMEEEFKALGYDYFPHRGAVTDEYLCIYKTLWTQDVASFQGRFYRFQDIAVHPHPVQRPHPPIWIGGHSTAAIRRAARLGDGWMPIGLRGAAGLGPEEMAVKVQQLREETRKAGREPDAVAACFSTGVSIGEPVLVEGERRPFSGPPTEVAADIRRYQQLGVQHFVFGFSQRSLKAMLDQIEHFSQQVRPLLAKR